MRLYARPSWQLARQLTADALVIIWSIGWWLTGRFADDLIRDLAGPARQTESAARSMAEGFADASRSASGVPWAGDTLRRPFDAAAAGLTEIVASARDQVVGIDNTATLVGWLTFVIPVSLVVAMWLPARVRFSLNSAAAATLIDAQPDLDLLALRAMATQPFHHLARISDDPLGAWRSGDRAVIDQLAELELRKNGWNRPALERRAATLPPPPAITP